MVKIQVTPLREKCIELISEQTVWKYTKEHCDSCEFCSFYRIDKCTALQTVKDSLRNLPETLIHSIFNEVYRLYTLHCDSSRPDPNFTESRPYINFTETNLLPVYLFSSILGLERKSMKIHELYLMEKMDFLFLLTFRKNIVTTVYLNQTLSRINSSLWETALRSLNLVQVIKLNGMEISDDFLELVGRECSQLKALDGIDACSDDITPQSFMKLFFRSNGTRVHRNKCCDTLESVQLNICEEMFLSHEFNDSHAVKLMEILGILIENLTNLKSVGEDFIFDDYLNSRCLYLMPENKIEEINFYKLRNNTMEILHAFSPKVKKVKVFFPESGFLQKLSSFEHLKELNITKTFGAVSTSLDIHFDIDLFIVKIPLLSDIKVTVSSVSWSGDAYFRHLEKAYFELSLIDNSNGDFTWFASFANSIKKMKIKSVKTVNYISVPFKNDNFQILLHVPFPHLKCLDIYPFCYDYVFCTTILENLGCLDMFLIDYKDDWDRPVCLRDGYRENQEKRIRGIAALTQFMKVNNLKCKLSKW